MMDIRITTQVITTVDGPTTVVKGQFKFRDQVARYTKTLPIHSTVGDLDDAVFAMLGDMVIWKNSVRAMEAMA
jgi:hypothetical protein